MNCQNFLVLFVLLFLLFLIILPCFSVPSSSRRKSGSGRDVEKYGERSERGHGRRSSGHRAKSGHRRKSGRRRERSDEDEDRNKEVEDKYKYNRNRDQGKSRREEGRRPSGNRDTRGRPTERQKSHGKQVEASDNYERRSSRTERRSKSRDRRKSGGRDGHGHHRRSRHERDGREKDGEGGHRHSSRHRERRRGSSRRDRSQTRQEDKSVSKSDAHKSKAKEYDEKTVPFLNRYAQQQSEKDNLQPSSSKSVGGSSAEQSKNVEREKSTGAKGEKKQRSGKREKSGNGKRRSSSRRPKSSTGHRKKSSEGHRGEGRAASGGGRVGVRMGRPVAIGRVVAADAKPKQSELEKAWRKELKVRYNHPIKHVFVEDDKNKKIASGVKPDKRAIKKINYKIPVNDLYDKQKVLDEMDQIIAEMVEMAASSRIESEDPDLGKEEVDERLTNSIDAKETAQIAYAYKTIIGYCYPELEKMYNDVDGQLKSRREELTKLNRNISSETEKVVKEYVWLSNKIDEANRSIEKGVRARHQKKLDRLNSEMDSLGDMSKADNVRTAELSERINETGNAIEKVEAEMRHERRLIKEMEENKKADQKRMADLKKQIEEMQDRNSFVQIYLDSLKQINKLAAEKTDLSASLSDLLLDRSYVDRARDIIDAPRDMLRQRKTRQVAAEDETWEEALAAERPKRNLRTMLKNITEENGTNHYSVYLAQVFTEEDKAALKKIIKDRINAEYKRMKESAAERSKSSKISKSRRSQSRTMASKSKSGASRSLRLSRAD